ncbi:MAG: ornithine carbamoyltransferase [Sulfolobales archaeon]
MRNKLRGKHILSALDLDEEDLYQIFDLSRDLKKRFYLGERIIPVLRGKILGLIFQKPSTRTRVSFEVAMKQLGGDTLYMSWNELQLGRGETIADTARVLSRYLDGVVARVYRQSDLEELANYSSIPIINGLSDLEHPIQAVSDFFTIHEKFGRFKGLKIAFVGDGSDNVLNSLLAVGSRLGIDFWIATPSNYQPAKHILEKAYEFSEKSGGSIHITEDPREAAKEADVVYTDVWVSMGQEAEREKRIRDLQSYRVDTKLMSLAKRNAVFMHCLPAHRGEEVTDEVMDGPNSIVWDQAENRLHVQKAILALVLQ